MVMEVWERQGTFGSTVVQGKLQKGFWWLYPIPFGFDVW